VKAVVVSDYGDADKLKLADVTPPSVSEGQVLIKLHFAGINFTDIYTRKGVYKKSNTYQNTLPFIPGMEGAGIVEAVGRGVSRVAPGDRVAYCLSLGSYAEFAIVPEMRVVKVPDDIELSCRDVPPIISRIRYSRSGESTYA